MPIRNVKLSQWRLIIAKFARRQTKIGLIPNKAKLKECENRIYGNEDLILFRTRLAKALRQREDVTSVILIDEKTVVSQANDSKIVFHSLFNLNEWDPVLITLFAK